MDIRVATVSEAPMLSELALASKRYWGYDDEFMELCRSELVVGVDQVLKNLVYVAVDEYSRALGFYSLKFDGDEAELDMLFVDPAHVRQGVGASLLRDALVVARRRGWGVLRVASDPFAAAFYESQGATRAGVATSPSTGRDLPLYELTT